MWVYRSHRYCELIQSNVSTQYPASCKGISAQNMAIRVAFNGILINFDRPLGIEVTNIFCHNRINAGVVDEIKLLRGAALEYLCILLQKQMLRTNSFVFFWKLGY